MRIDSGRRPAPARIATGYSAIAVLVAVIAVLVAVIAVIALVAPAGAVAAAVPLPDQDPFYAVPANVAKLANGAIIKSRPVQTFAYDILPMPATGWQVQYKSLDTSGHATADVATVMVPATAWHGSGPRPLLSYQTAEDGVGSKCSPSYSLRGGLQATGNSEAETGLMLASLEQGWAVVAPDYEGPHSDFLGASGEGDGVLDGIRAALAFKPAAVSPNAPIGMWGYSGGSLASVLAAMSQKTYAPKLHFTAIALGGLVTDLKATLLGFSGGPGGGAIVVGLAGVDRSYPSANLEQYLNATGRNDIANSQSDCLTDALLKYPAASISQFEAYPGAIDSPGATALLHEISPLYLPGIPTAPIYDYHAIGDEFAPIPGDRQMMHRFCNAGLPVQHVEDAVGEHITEALTGAPGAISYLAARFAGQPTPSDCASIPAGVGPLTAPAAPAPQPKHPAHHRRRHRGHHK